MINKFIPVIGMEVHVELKTNSKMFCSCKNDPDEKTPNTNICEICLAHPGTLPAPNKKAIEWTVLIGKALGCSIRELSKFDRKHYFYPDLPKGYQISQYDEPIAEHGEIKLQFFLEKNPRDEAVIHIQRAHLEEDTARLAHNSNQIPSLVGRGEGRVSQEDSNSTLADFNRAGIPLVEIVTYPDFKTPIEAKVYCQELQRIMRSLGVSDADMEKGHMRCEANVSMQEEGRFEIVEGVVNPIGDYKLNGKVELKNINSFRAVEKAIQFEIERQTKMLDNKETWQQQTRGWDEDKGETVLQRVKESAADYRYFPDPDIPPFHPLKIAGAVKLPELPPAKRVRFHEEYGFSYSDALILTSDLGWADFAEAVMSELVEWITASTPKKEANDELKETKQQALAKLCGGWLTSKLMGAMSERNLTIDKLKISPENFAELITLIYVGKVNSTNAQKILLEMIDAGTDFDPTHIMEEKGYGQISDEAAIGKVVDEVIVNYPEQVKAFKAGKEPIIKFLIGMAMKATEGSADPKIVEQLLRNKMK